MANAGGPYSGRKKKDAIVFDGRASTDPDGDPLTFEEALLSTEYGEDGVQRRATLELWPSIEEMRPLRGAGTLISSVAVRRQGLDSQIAFFRWSIEGREGLGTYEVARSIDG